MIISIFNNICSQIASLYPCKETQKQHAWWILEHVTGYSKGILLTNSVTITPVMHQRIDTVIRQHVKEHKPLAYIFGSIPFGHCNIITEHPILIPRPETEEWVLQLIDLLKIIPGIDTKPLSILDLCSGSGCIGIALAHAFPNAHITALDIEPKAIALINKNSMKNNINNITSIQSDLFDALEKTKPQFDIIVSNPPYITPDEYTQLNPSVSLWEDPKALYTDDQGLAIIKKIIKKAPSYLQYNEHLAFSKIPQLIIEIGHTQGDSVKTIMKSEHYDDVQVKKDFADKDRIVMGRVYYGSTKKTP